MRTATPTLLVAVALLALAGCAKKKPAELPPPPQQSTANPNDGGVPSSTEMGGANRPGSRADFVAQAGSDTVLFATDSYDVDGQAQGVLTRQVAWLRRYPTVRITIEGHCDERGTREYNLALGDRRANSAKNFLVNAGIPAARIATISYGKERPVAQGSDENAWAQNRRAVTVVPESAPNL